MKVIFARVEVKASLNLISGIFDQLPKGFLTETAKEETMFAIESYAQEEDFNEETLTRLNEVLKTSTVEQVVKVCTDGQLEINLDPELLAEVIDVVTDNVDTFFSIGLTAYGLVRTLLSSLKKMGKKVDEVVKKHKKRLIAE